MVPSADVSNVSPRSAAQLSVTSKSQRKVFANSGGTAKPKIAASVSRGVSSLVSSSIVEEGSWFESLSRAALMSAAAIARIGSFFCSGAAGGVSMRMDNQRQTEPRMQLTAPVARKPRSKMGKEQSAVSSSGVNVGFSFCMDFT